jgi:hypothetical protein
MRLAKDPTSIVVTVCKGLEHKLYLLSELKLLDEVYTLNMSRCLPSGQVSKHLPQLRRAGERPWAWDGVRCRLWPVHLELDARVSTLVCSWEADGCRTGGASSRHVELGTFHVKLRSRVVSSAVESNELCSEKVSGVYGQTIGLLFCGKVYLLSTGDARGQHKVYQPLVVVQSCDCPLAICIHAILIDFEPLETSHLATQSIVDFREVHHNRPQMTGIDRIGLVRLWLRVKRVVPFGSELVPSFDLAPDKPHPCGVFELLPS